MGKIKEYKRVSLFLIIAILLIAFFYATKNNNEKSILSKDTILAQIENSYNKKDLSKDYISTVNNYLKDSNKDSKYYFIKGYLNYTAKNYNLAIEDFITAKNSINKKDPSFMKIYLCILLNKSLIKINESYNLVDNAEVAFKYISEDKKYKNNNDLIWENISTLIYYDETINSSIRLLDDYLNQTNGLSTKCRVSLTSNLGFLYSLNFKYAKSIYKYLEAIDLLDENQNINGYEVHKVKLMVNIGDIIFMIGDYDNAIKYYNKAIDIDIKDKHKNAIAKSMAYVNRMQSYIEIGEYDKVISDSKIIYDKLKYHDKDSVDDIKISMLNVLGLAYTQKHEFKTAKKLLDKSADLLKKDKIKRIIHKDSFIKYSYAKYYQENKEYNRALELYDKLLTESKERGLGFEIKIYESLCDIYLSKNDIQNYAKYEKLLLKEEDTLNNNLKKDYIKYATNLYESDKLKEQNHRKTIKVIILVFGIIIMSIVLIYKMKSVKILRQLNFTEGMTNLYNRTYLNYYIKKNKKNIVNTSLSIILIDIDYFKKYNDNYGHIKGDEAIKEVANSIKESIKKEDIAIRYGGEEMVIILPYTNIEEAKDIAKNIQTNIKNKNIEHRHSDVSQHLTISIGIYNDIFKDKNNIYYMIDKADKALYKAKNNGRNRYEVY